MAYSTVEKRMVQDAIYYRAHAQHRKDYMTNWRRVVRQEAFELLGARCVQCGNPDGRVLQFDHIVPQPKSQRVHQRQQEYYGVILGTNTNLQLLCANCHAIKTFEESDGRYGCCA